MEAHFYEPRFKSEKILALADVDVASGVIVRGFRIVRGPRGLFAAVPSRSVHAEGQPRYYHQVVFSSNDIRDRFLGTLLEAYHQWEKDRGAQAVREEVTSASG
jgi:DNA-binding cell septation regulator SpoVG